MNYGIVMMGLPCSAVFVFVWEHMGRSRNWWLRPSFLLTNVAAGCTFAWEILGYAFARVSSFYARIKWTELLATAHDLTKPCVDICTSPYYFIKGYVTEMNVYDHPYLITAGSATLVGGTAYLAHKYGLWQYTASVVRSRIF